MVVRTLAELVRIDAAARFVGGGTEQAPMDGVGALPRYAD